MNVVLVGNPNVGKTTLFNALTGLNHKVGNYPGITVDKKTAKFKISEQDVVLTDLPGLYSIYPNSSDEEVVIDDVLLNPEFQVDKVVVVVEPEHLKRNLLLFSQVQDLGYPVVLAINMMDKCQKLGLDIDIDGLSKELDAVVVPVNAKKGEGLEVLKGEISADIRPGKTSILQKVGMQTEFNPELNTKSYKEWVKEAFSNPVPEFEGYKKKEAVKRYVAIRSILKETYKVSSENREDGTAKLDKVLLHPFWGYVIFLGMLGLVFQSIFAWSSIPMDFIDSSFANMANWTKETLPEGMFTNLFADGIIAGIGGVVIFVPQIAILFLFITLLELSGYMSRAVLLMDKIMRKFGLSGKAVVPLLSGTACAIPAVMSARNIEDPKERLITMLIAPFTTCSARLPVYAILITLVIPETQVGGVFNLQGLVLFGLYFLGFGAAVIGAWVLSKFFRKGESVSFVVEVPRFEWPSLKTVGITIWEKTMSFVVGAGKIILAISIVLWFAASYGPGDKMDSAESYVRQTQPQITTDTIAFNDAVSSRQLEVSYIGYAGKFIEPVISPLGYDWKIGIGLVSSFAAREVFVGTMATIYSVGSAGEDEGTIKAKMAKEKYPDGKPVYTLAVGLSLLVFYALAMQCMSTLAVVKRETNTWKWPLIQFFVMGGLAYIGALIVYQIFK